MCRRTCRYTRRQHVLADSGSELPAGGTGRRQSPAVCQLHSRRQRLPRTTSVQLHQHAQTPRHSQEGLCSAKTAERIVRRFGGGGKTANSCERRWAAWITCIAYVDVCGCMLLCVCVCVGCPCGVINDNNYTGYRCPLEEAQ